MDDYIGSFWFWVVLISAVVAALVATAKWSFRAGMEWERTKADAAKKGYYWSEFAGHGQWRKVEKRGDFMNDRYELSQVFGDFPEYALTWSVVDRSVTDRTALVASFLYEHHAQLFMAALTSASHPSGDGDEGVA